MLNKNNCGLIVVDVQGKLAQIMPGSEALIHQLKILIQGVKILGLPIVWMEQLPNKLGATHPELAALLPDTPLSKDTFSGWQTAAIRQKIELSDCDHWLVAGIEAHVCVYQTVADLLLEGLQTHLVVDAIASRVEPNKTLAINKMQQLGSQLTSVEMALFELQQVAAGDEFKQLIQLIK